MIARSECGKGERCHRYNRKDKEWLTDLTAKSISSSGCALWSAHDALKRVVAVSCDDIVFGGKAKQRGLSWPGAFGFAHLFLGVKSLQRMQVVKSQAPTAYQQKVIQVHSRFVFPAFFLQRCRKVSRHYWQGGSKSGCQTKSHFFYTFSVIFNRWL